MKVRTDPAHYIWSVERDDGGCMELSHVLKMRKQL